MSRKVAVGHVLLDDFTSNFKACDPVERIEDSAEWQVRQVCTILKSYGWDVFKARISPDPLAVFAGDMACPFYSETGNAILLMHLPDHSRLGEIDRWRNFYGSLLPDDWEIISIDDPLGIIDGKNILVPPRPYNSSQARNSPVYYVRMGHETSDHGITAFENVATAYGAVVRKVRCCNSCPSLRSAVTWLHGNDVLIDGDWISSKAFVHGEMNPIMAWENGAADVLYLPSVVGKGIVIISDAYPMTATRLESRGYVVHPVAFGSVECGGGGLSRLFNLLTVG